MTGKQEIQATRTSASAGPIGRQLPWDGPLTSDESQDYYDCMPDVMFLSFV